MQKAIILVVALFSTLAHAGFPSDLREQLQKIITDSQEVLNAGVAIGIIKDGEVFTAGFGLRDREKKLPVTPDTLFGIGSTTKAFVSTSILMAEEAGLLNTKEPIRTYLPEFSIQVAGASDVFNTYDLLSHRSGLPRHDLAWLFNPELDYTKLPARIQYFEKNPKEGMGFREGFQYNNMMYGIAGSLLETRAGAPWTHIVQEKLLNPLGMVHTNFSVDISSKSENVALPYGGVLRLLFRNIDHAGPAGAINSNVNDMLLWTQALLRGGKFSDGAPFLSAERFAELFSQQTIIQKSPISEEYYGLGWIISNVRGMQIISHGGNIDGYTTLVMLVPADSFALVVLVNQNSSELPGTIARELLSRFATPKEKLPVNPFGVLAKFASLDLIPQLDFAKAKLEPNINAWLHAIAKQTEVKSEPKKLLDLQKIIGTYEHPGYGEVIIEPYLDFVRMRFYNLQSGLNAQPENTFQFTIPFGGTDHVVPGKVVFAEDGTPIEILMPFEDESGDWTHFKRKN